LLDVSGAFKTPAKEGFPESTLSSAFQEIYLGCCTVAAQLSNSFLVDDYPFLGDPVTFIEAHRYSENTYLGRILAFWVSPC
jgi:hypothetical protein